MKEKRLALVLLVLAAAVTATVLMARPRHQGLEQTSVADLWVTGHELALGRISPDHSARTQIELHNLGHGVVKIESVIPDCGCMTAELSERQIGPGDSVPIAVILDPRRTRGADIDKRVLVRLRDSADHPQDLVFHVSGVVDRDPIVTAIPEHINFGPVVSGVASPSSAVVYVTGPKDYVEALPSSFRISSLADQTVSVRAGRLESGLGSKAVALELTPGSDWPRGPFSTNLNFDFVGPRPAKTRLRITGEVSAPLIAAPRMLYLTCGPASPSAAFSLEVIALTKLEIDPAAISSDLPVSWTVSQFSPQNDRLTLEIRSQAQRMERVQTGYLRIKTKSPVVAIDVPVVIAPVTPTDAGPAGEVSGP